MKYNRYLNAYVPPGADTLHHWAKSGRPDLIVKDMLQRADTDSPWEMASPHYLWKALDEATAQGPEHLIAASFQEMFEMYYRLQVRLHYLLNRTLRAWDQSEYSLDILNLMVNMFLPVMEHVDRHFLQAVRQYTAAKRSLDLLPWPQIPAIQEGLAPAESSSAPAELPAEVTELEEPQVELEELAARVDPEPGEDMQGLRAHHA